MKKYLLRYILPLSTCIKYRRIFFAPHERDGSKILNVAVQGLRAELFFVILIASYKALSRQKKCRMHVYLVNGISRGFGSSVTSQLKRNPLISFLLDIPWLISYIIVGASKVERSVKIESLSERKAIDRLVAKYSDFSKSLFFPEFVIDGIQVGDLVVDTYIRFKPSASFDPSDPFAYEIFRQCCKDIVLSRKFFEKQKTDVYFTSYTTYVEHGIVVRVALSLGIRVYAWGNNHLPGKKITSHENYHQVSSANFRENFQKIKNKKSALILASHYFERRFAGEVDSSIIYMAESAYTKSDDLGPDVQGAIIIFLHRFFDSPHTYPNFIFNDLYEWVLETCNYLEHAGIRYFVKEHPNGDKFDSEIVDTLKNRFGHKKFISKRVTNLQLIERGMVAGVSVRGTVISELGFFGIPSVTCSRNLHVGYNFCLNAENKTDYFKLLSGIPNSSFDTSALRQDALEFMYMRNIYGPPEFLQLREYTSDVFAIFDDRSKNRIKGNLDHQSKLYKMYNSIGMSEVIRGILDIESC